MNTRSTIFKTIVLGAAILTPLALSGCAKHDKLPANRTRAKEDISGFSAGAGRSPTPNTSYAFAKILIGQGRDRDALHVLSRVIREHPQFVAAYNESASIYVRADRIDDAIGVLGQGLERAPKDAVLLNNLGMCHMLAGEHEEALGAFTRAAEQSPTNPSYRANRAAALALVGRTAEAETEYRTVLGRSEARQNLKILSGAAAAVTATSHEKPAGAVEQPADAGGAEVIPPPIILEPAAVETEAQPMPQPVPVSFLHQVELDGIIDEQGTDDAETIE